MRPWSVDCPQCTSFLDGDPLWARSLAEVPESHDEIKARQQYELAGSRNQRNIVFGEASIQGFAELFGAKAMDCRG